MVRCKYCGAEGLVWEAVPPTRGYQLNEPDGMSHECKPEDRRKEHERVLKEKAENDEATRRYREANGYL